MIRAILTVFLLVAAQDRSLRIVVISGEEAVNIIQQKTAVAPIVEVRDRNNQPVAGAIVRFTIQGGRNATIAGANTLTVTTNAVGQAAVTGLTPTSAGAVQINVAAAFQGQTATAAITQTNFATAAQTVSASSGSVSGGSAGGASGGGGIGAGTITGIAAAAAGTVGGLYAYNQLAEGKPPVLESMSAFPTVGVQGATPITLLFSGTSHESGSITFDFGDGTVLTARGSDAPPTHVYSQAGTFTVRVTLTAHGQSSSGQTTVTIKSVTGTWNLERTGVVFTLTQNGSTVIGTYTAPTTAITIGGSGSVTGTVSSQTPGSNTPNITLTVAGLGVSFAGRSQFNDTADILIGTFTSGPNTISNAMLIRQ